LESLNRRVTDAVLLCEDGQHEAFARRFLVSCGLDRRRIRVEKAPRGRGSGEQWVRQAYAKEVGALRSAPHIKGRVLFVVIDEDTSATTARSAALAESLVQSGLKARLSDEAIVHAIPARNIETWLAYLGGAEVDEETSYQKLPRERDCASQATALKEMCDQRSLRQPAPPSLERACEEFRVRWRR